MLFNSGYGDYDDYYRRQYYDRQYYDYYYNSGHYNQGGYYDEHGYFHADPSAQRFVDFFKMLMFINCYVALMYET